MPKRERYPSDIKDEQWEVLKRYIPPPLNGGRPARYERREILNGILYVLRTGCAWRELPHDLPPWDTVYGYMRRWTPARSLGIGWENVCGKTPSANTPTLRRLALESADKARPLHALIG